MTDVQPLLTDDLLPESSKAEKAETDRLLCIISTPPLYKSNYHLISHEQEQALDPYNIEGELYRRETRSSNWTLYYYKYNAKKLELECFKSKEHAIRHKNKPSHVIPVSWLWAQKAEPDDAFINQQLKMAKNKNSAVPEVCTYRVSVFSPKRTYIITSDADSQITRLIDAVRSSLEIVMTPDERQMKQEVAEKLGPMQHKQVVAEREQYKSIVKSLQVAGIFPDRGTMKKRREGTLEMQKPDGTWKKYYFVLFKESLSYFHMTDKSYDLMPRGVILLDHIIAVKPLAPTSRKTLESMEVENLVGLDEDEMDIDTSSTANAAPSSPKAPEKLPKQPFLVCTPLRTYTLRARHVEAMKDWALKIFELRAESSKIPLPLPSTVTRDEVEGIPAPGKKDILYEVNGKTKSFRMKKESIVIGRSTKADIYISDPKISRNHARIEMNSKGVPVLYDMGSLCGTLLNGVKVIKHPLKNGDTFLLGNTTFTFKVESKK